LLRYDTCLTTLWFLLASAHMMEYLMDNTLYILMCFYFYMCVYIHSNVTVRWKLRNYKISGYHRDNCEALTHCINVTQ
jgi:hypothetical protein